MKITRVMIEPVRIGPEKNFTYFIQCEESGEAALIDPAFEFKKIFDWVKQLSKTQVKMKYLLATHGHWDHAGGMNEMKKLFPEAKITSHKNEVLKLKELNIKADHLFSETDFLNPAPPSMTLTLGHHQIFCYLTPGHTPGGLTYQIAGQLFTGDTLFIGQCGRTDLEGGSDAKLFQSLNHLKSLNPELIIRPGHDYGDKPYDTVKNQMRVNPTLRAQSLKEFQSLD